MRTKLLIVLLSIVFCSGAFAQEHEYSFMEEYKAPSSKEFALSTSDGFIQVKPGPENNVKVYYARRFAGFTESGWFRGLCCGLVILLTILIAVTPAAAKKKSKRKPVHPGKVEIPEEFAGAGAVVLTDIVDWSIDPSTAISTVIRQKRLLVRDRSGLDAAAQAVTYDAEDFSIESLRAWTVNRSQKAHPQFE